MRFNCLQDWLTHAENLTDRPIELGLARMKTMLDRLRIAFHCPVFTVAGTNGKGSTCAMLNAILLEAGYHVGMHTSPHLLRFNERAVINGKEVDDASFIEAFKAVEIAREGMPLTYFEFTGLAILWLFNRAKLDAVILEIGLGGRLDAMNAIDTHCGIVCAIGIDHTAYLGTTREEIAYEKACIYRSGMPAIVTDRKVPSTLVNHAQKIGARLKRYGLDFETLEKGDRFDFFEGDVQLLDLPCPFMPGVNQIQNAAGVLCALTSFSKHLPVTQEAIMRGLLRAYLPARFERVGEIQGVDVILDVGHNPQAAEVLKGNVQACLNDGRRLWAVFGMLRDKDMQSVSRIMAPVIDRWFVASLTGPRAASAAELMGQMRLAGIAPESMQSFTTVDVALVAALKQAQMSPEPVRILVFGSFVTVAAAKGQLALLVS